MENELPPEDATPLSDLPDPFRLILSLINQVDDMTVSCQVTSR